MRKTLLLFCSLFLTAGVVFAQAQSFQSIRSTPAPMMKKAYTGMEEAVRPDVPSANLGGAFDRTFPETIAGNTTYDLQTNGAVQNRLQRNPNDNSLSAVWTYGVDAGSGFPNRGTGYNKFVDGEGWGPIPSQRIEDGVRTGWPSLSLLADGSEVVIAHSSDSELVVNRNVGGSWEQSTIPSMAPPGLLWPRSAAAGPDGNTIHAIAITTPVANDGAEYEGVDGHILYHRSTDGGETWDIVDAIIPGFDSTMYVDMFPDSYAIDASGNTVAVALFADFGDVAVAISEDNGETWSFNIINDFELDKYVTNQGYDPAVIDPVDVANGPTDADGIPIGTALQTSDGTGDVLIDNEGKVHVWYGEMYVQDTDLTDEGTSFFPAWSGVRYWNEDHGPDSTRVIADLVDADGNGQFDLADANQIASYFTSITSFISSGIDEEGGIFIAFSALSEEFVNPNASPNAQNNRHIYMTASSDGGETWTDTPVDLLRPDIVLEPDLLPAQTGVFPSVTRNIGSSIINLIYQADYEPGLHVRGDEDAAGPNSIVHIAVTRDEFANMQASNTEIVDASTFDFNISPNPASDFLRVNYELPEAAEITLTITNSVGQVVRVIDNGRHIKGMFDTQIDISDLSQGMYIVQFQADDQMATQKLIVK